MSTTLVFTGGGTGGHIFPGLAVADEIKQLCGVANKDCRIVWIGSAKGMDGDIISKSESIDKFYGIPTGKLRRYFSFENLVDVFKIIGGCIASFFLLLKLKPAIVFSKGGFVSVPPCLAAGLLKIPVFTHECDFSPGLATKLNSRVAKKILLSYPQTASYFRDSFKERLEVTGNPVRPVFYKANGDKGRKFLGLQGDKPVLLVLGGSSGARQINKLVLDNLDFLTEHFQVIHQTGGEKSGFTESEIPSIREGVYKHYGFIYQEMPDVIAAADLVLSRAGANSLWECAVLGKPMILIPLWGAGTRGDQVENARLFVKSGVALSLEGDEADGNHLKAALVKMMDKRFWEEASKKAYDMSAGTPPARKIAEIVFYEVSSR